MISIKGALSILDSLIPKRPSTAESVFQAWTRMGIYCEALGLTSEKLHQLKVIHVTGSKGKGSTCSMVESILRHSGYKTGLYTSPHLCDIRERIRLDGSKIDEDTFTQQLYWIHERLEKLHLSNGVPLPGYFQFLTLLALLVFCHGDVDVAVLEVGMGGSHDPTNIIPAPHVCGVTSISLEHTDILGATLGDIAYAKGGIFKPDCVAWTVAQFQEVRRVLEQRARDAGAPLFNTGHVPEFRNLTTVPGLGGKLLQNAALAVQLARTVEQRLWSTGHLRPELRRERPQYMHRMSCLDQQHRLPESYLQGLNHFERSGRYQRVLDTEFMTTRLDPSEEHTSRLTFYIDGAHNTDSLHACIGWFRHLQEPIIPSHALSFLVFGSSEGKDTESLLGTVASAIQSRSVPFRHVFFVPLTTQRMRTTSFLNRAYSNLYTWLRLTESGAAPKLSPLPSIDRTSFIDNSSVKQRLNMASDSPADVFPSTMSTIGWFRNFCRGHREFDVRVLVTGSLYLAADFLKILGHAPK